MSFEALPVLAIIFAGTMLLGLLMTAVADIVSVPTSKLTYRDKQMATELAARALKFRAIVEGVIIELNDPNLLLGGEPISRVTYRIWVETKVGRIARDKRLGYVVVRPLLEVEVRQTEGGDHTIDVIDRCRSEKVRYSKFNFDEQGIVNARAFAATALRRRVKLAS